MKTLVVYHSKDLDGIASGAITVKGIERSFGVKPHVYPYDYADDTNELLDYIQENEFTHVYFVDVTVPVVNLYELLNNKMKRSCRAIIIDHHVSYKETHDDFFPDGSELIELHYDNTQAACELCWYYFFADKDIPQLVTSLAIWDIHRDVFNFDFHRNIQMGLRVIDNAYDLDGLWKMFFQMEVIQHAYEYGSILYRKERDQARRLLKMASHIDGIEGGILAINSEVNNAIKDVTGLPVMFYVYDGSIDRWKVEFRKSELCPEDVLRIVKKWDGGGHPNACGAILDDHPISFLKVAMRTFKDSMLESKRENNE